MLSKLGATALFLAALTFAPAVRADEYDTCKASGPARLAAFKNAVTVAVAMVNKAKVHGPWIKKHCKVVDTVEGYQVSCNAPLPKGLDYVSINWIFHFDMRDRVYSGPFAAENEACEMPDSVWLDFLLYSFEQIFSDEGKTIRRIMMTIAP